MLLYKQSYLFLQDIVTSFEVSLRSPPPRAPPPQFVLLLDHLMSTGHDYLLMSRNYLVPGVVHGSKDMAGDAEEVCAFGSRVMLE